MSSDNPVVGPNIETLATLIEKYPQWKDLPIVVFCSDGGYDYIGKSGLVYEDACTEEESVLVFTGN